MLDGRRVIYLLDDSEAMLSMMAATLAPYGEVRGFTDWSELALPVSRAGERDLLISDLNLDTPEMQGGTFCQLVRRQNGRLRVVVFSASPEEVPAGAAHVVVPKGPGCLAGLQAAVAALVAEEESWLESLGRRGSSAR